jgi:Ca2+-binding EF-hand superfamily protein
MKEIEALIEEVFKSPLTISTIDELKQQAKSAYLSYCYADSDQNGILTADEILILCERMGLKAGIDEEETLMKMDDDGSYTVDIEEWLRWWLTRVSKLPNPIKQQEIIARNTFQRFDKDGSNSMDVSEFKDLVESLGVDFSDDELEEVITLLDTNRSGSIDMEEFVDWWTQRTAQLRYGNSNIAAKLRRLASRASQRFSTDIFTATWQEDVELVKIFIENDRKSALAVDVDGNNWSALHYAAYKGNMVIIDLLLKAGALINKTNTHGFTPLFYAAQCAHVDVCAFLLEAGADPTIEGEEEGSRMTAIEHAVDTSALQPLFSSHTK